MDTDQSALKTAAKIALAALACLLVGAVVFYKERLFADTSFIAFNIINYNTLYIQEHRYGSFITQIVPCLGAMLHLPIKVILISYAISFNVFYLVVAWLLAYRLKQFGLAVLMAFYYFLFVSASYFWPANEINQAVAWMFLFFGVTLYLGNRKVNIFLLLLPFTSLAFLTITTHFVVVIPTVFLWIYFWIEKKNWPFSKNISILLSCFLVGVIALKYLLVASGSYDGKHLYGVTHFSIKDIINCITTPVIGMFFQRCITNYWIAIMVFVTSVATLIRKKESALTTWTLVSFIGYCIILGLTYGDEDRNVQLFHIESEWTCICIIMATPFVFSFLPKMKPSFVTVSLSAIFLIRLVYIGMAVPAFVWRTDFQEKVLTQMRKKNISKLALYRNQETQSKYLLDWTSVYESLFSSAVNGDKPEISYCFVNKDDKHTLELIANPYGYYDAFYFMSPKNLNASYFSVDTTQPYQVMTEEAFFKE